MLIALICSFNGWGVMIVDSLDTMYIMNLHDEFKRALAFVEKATWDVPKVCYINQDYANVLY